MTGPRVSKEDQEEAALKNEAYGVPGATLRKAASGAAAGEEAAAASPSFIKRGLDKVRHIFEPSKP